LTRVSGLRGLAEALVGCVPDGFRAASPGGPAQVPVGGVWTVAGGPRSGAPTWAMNSLRRDWSQFEVEAIVADYFDMLGKELRGEPYNKPEHRRQLQKLLDRRTEGSIEYKHENISAVLIELGQPYVEGYKPQRNYQELLFEVIEERLSQSQELLKTVEEKVEEEAEVPSVGDILERLVDPPPLADHGGDRYVRERQERRRPSAPNYLLREARNASLGRAGEEFVLNFERARLLSDGKEELAADVEHVSMTRGDHEGGYAPENLTRLECKKVQRSGGDSLRFEI